MIARKLPAQSPKLSTKEACVKLTEVASDCRYASPNNTIAAVAVHTTNVSINTPSAWISPCLTGWERSEEHTSELQSRENLVCRLLLEKKKKKNEERRQ